MYRKRAAWATAALAFLLLVAWFVEIRWIRIAFCVAGALAAIAMMRASLLWLLLANAKRDPDSALTGMDEEG